MNQRRSILILLAGMWVIGALVGYVIGSTLAWERIEWQARELTECLMQICGTVSALP